MSRHLDGYIKNNIKKSETHHVSLLNRY